MTGLMPPFSLRVLAALLTASLQSGWSQQEPAQPAHRVESAGLFKNGLTVIRMKASIPPSGPLTLDTIPEPVHGTFWIRSAKPVTARVLSSERPAPLGGISHGQLLSSLAGKQVTLTLGDDTLEGVLLGGGEGNLTFLRSKSGRVVAFEPRQVTRIECDALPELTVPRSVLSLEAEGGGEVAIEYLAHGLSWAPAYRIDLSDPAVLSILQQAVVRNELTDLSGTEVELISGFPSVRYANAISPLSPTTTWADFFSRLGSEGASIDGLLSQQVRLTENRLSMPVFGAPAGEAIEGVDLHYQSIGKTTLAKGENLAVTVAESTSPYERVVEWNIPDTRNRSGRPDRDPFAQGSAEGFDETPWDAIRFANPFPFPMTTAAAVLTSGGRFQGQQRSDWANPGQETSVRITKALSISVRHTEHEIPESRQELLLAGNDHYRTDVQGEITVQNFRGAPAVLLIKRRFSGELLEAEGDPARQLLEEGVFSINKRNELTWREELGAGEERTRKYRYQVLVDN